METTKHGIVSICEMYNIGKGNSRLSLWDYICEACGERVLNPRMITSDLEFVLERYWLEKYDVIDLARATGGRKIHDKFWIEVID